MSMTGIDITEIPRKKTFLFFLIDTSGSMAGDKIGKVNSAIEEVLLKLKEMNDTNADAIIEIAILTFDSNVKWLTPDNPMNPANFHFNRLEVGGLTYIGEAFRSLEEKLHKSCGFMESATGSYAPTIFFMSDGEPTDEEDWESKLALLKENLWFKVSAKVALAVGDDVSTHVHEKFTGHKEAVVHISDKDVVAKLAKMITFISVRSSQVSSSHDVSSTTATAQDKINNLIVDAINDDDWDLDGDSDDSNWDID
jgi:uncharacterized protein YegL